MTLKKQFKLGRPVVIGGGGQNKMFLPGYRWVIGDVTYTVIKAFVSDNTEMRQVKTSNGDIEDLTIRTIMNDHRGGMSVLDPVNIEKPRES